MAVPLDAVAEIRHGAGPAQIDRLDRVRKELTGDAVPASVTEVAVRWGFTHTSRFAADYRRRFGVAPSADRSRRA